MLLKMLAAILIALSGVSGLEPPTQLLVEYLPSPVLGIDVRNPRFSWAVKDTDRDVNSTAYQIVTFQKGSGTVSDKPVWDTGRVASSSTTHVAYDGPALLPDTRYTWQVRWWKQDVKDPSPFATTVEFHTGLFSAADWHGARGIRASVAPPSPAPPPPPAPPTCQGPACRMVEIPGKQFYAGDYNETQAHNVSSQAACIATCLADSACVQITWAPAHGDKCVMYSRVTARKVTVSGAIGWLKLSGTFVRSLDTVCPVAGYPKSCVWFHSFSDDTRRFVSNCDQYPTACGAKQRSCWPQFDMGLGIVDVNDSYIISLKAGPNYSCEAEPPFAPADPSKDPKSPASMLRHNFHTTSAASQAMLYLSAVGWVEAYVNGENVAPIDALNPGRSNFDVRQWYMAYDVTSLIKEGDNAIGVLLGGGWQSQSPSQAQARAFLSILGADSSSTRIVTDESWSGTQTGPITAANIYNGEMYDARKELPGWAMPSFNESTWSAAIDVNMYTSAKLSWQRTQPIRKLELNKAVSITPVTLQASSEVVHVFEFPQNAAGWSRLELQDCPAGTQISMYFAEVLCGYGTTRWSKACTGQFGTVDQRNLHGSWHNVYTCKGGGAEVYEPRFTYCGHRFVQVHGLPHQPKHDTLLQRVVHSDVESSPVPDKVQTFPRSLAGSIAFGEISATKAPLIDGSSCYEGETCEAEPPLKNATVAVLDQVSHNIRWTLIDNLHSVPEDCDQRNERWGWMADASVSAEADYNYHWMPGMYTQWLTLMEDVQTEPSAKCSAVTGPQGDTNVVDGHPNCSGAVGDLTPGHTPADMLPGDPSWMMAYPLVYSYQHRYFADERLARVLWPGILAYASFLQGMAARGKTGLVSFHKYGDWLQPGRVASIDLIGEMTSSFNFVQTLRITRDTANVLGDSSAAASYAAAFAVAKKAFHTKYWTGKTYGDGTQTALAYALYLGAVPQQQDADVFAELLALIKSGTKECDSTPCLTTGIIATKWIMELLSIRGRTDLGLDLAFKTDYPSWGYMAKMNSTTVWEHWEYMNGPGMNSHNHPAFASVGAWLFRWVAGLRLNDGTLEVPSEGYGKGWSHILFAPGCVTDPRLPAVQARVSTLHGPVLCSWANQTTRLTMSISLPPNTAADIRIPSSLAPSSTKVTEGGTVVWQDGRFISGVLGVRSGSISEGTIVLRLGSGSYRFSAAPGSFGNEVVI